MLLLESSGMWFEVLGSSLMLLLTNCVAFGTPLNVCLGFLTCEMMMNK